MTTARETVLQAVRLFIKTALGYPVTLSLGPPPVIDTGDGVVLIAGDKGPRPALPYCTVQAIGIAAGVGRDETLRTKVAGVPKQEQRGHRRCTVQVSIYGTTSDEWLESIRLAIGSPLAQAAIASTGVQVANVLDVRPSLELRDTAFESSAQIDLECTYRLTTAPATAVAATTAGWTVTIDQPSNPPADLPVTGTATI
jgi:hypothetical protein